MGSLAKAVCARLRPPAPKVLPATCEAFLEDWYGLTLTKGQRVLVKVGVDRVPVAELPDDEAEIAAGMFGDLSEAPELAWRTLVAACGRDSGKTELGAGIALYKLLSVDVSRCGPGDIPRGFIVAPDMDTASLTIERATARIEASPELRPLLIGKAGTLSIKLRRLDGRVVKLEVRSASRGGKSMRGRSVLVLIMDEAAFFTSDGFAVNDNEIVRAVRPRVVKGGLIAMLSTLYIEEGLFFDLYTRNRERARTAIVAHAPSLVMRDGDVELAERIELEREDDPENADREYFCILSAGDSVHFFPADLLKLCVNENRPAVLPFDQRFDHVAAGDLGFRKNSSTLGIVRLEDNVAKLVYHEERKPKRGAPLVPGEVCEGFGLKCAEYGTFDLMLDYESIESARQFLGEVRAVDPRQAHLQKPGTRGVTITEFNPGTQMEEAFTRVRTAMREGRVELPRDPRLLQQLKSAKAVRKQGGKTSIVFPTIAGAHGDLAIACVMALSRYQDNAYGRKLDALSKIMRGQEPEPTKTAAQLKEERELEQMRRMTRKAG